MQAAILVKRPAAKSCDASLWMNLFIVALPVLIVIALGALALWLLTTGGRTRA
jgi:hypothetical protein